MKILLATDGSPSSELAAQSIATRPWPAGSAVKLISVVEIHLAPAPTEFPQVQTLSAAGRIQAAARVPGAWPQPRPALHALEQWQFQPAMSNGRAVSMRVEIPMVFRLEE